MDFKKYNSSAKEIRTNSEYASLYFFRQRRPGKAHLKEGLAFVVYRGYLLRDRVESSLLK